MYICLGATLCPLRLFWDKLELNLQQKFIDFVMQVKYNFISKCKTVKLLIFSNWQQWQSPRETFTSTFCSFKSHLEEISNSDSIKLHWMYKKKQSHTEVSVKPNPPEWSTPAGTSTCDVIYPWINKTKSFNSELAEIKTEMWRRVKIHCTLKTSEPPLQWQVMAENQTVQQSADLILQEMIINDEHFHRYCMLSVDLSWNNRDVPWFAVKKVIKKTILLSLLVILSHVFKFKEKHVKVLYNDGCWKTMNYILSLHFGNEN